MMFLARFSFSLIIFSFLISPIAYSSNDEHDRDPKHFMRQQGVQSTFLTMLPQEVVETIASYLSDSDLIKAGSCCKEWHSRVSTIFQRRELKYPHREDDIVNKIHANQRGEDFRKWWEDIIQRIERLNEKEYESLFPIFFEMDLYQFFAGGLIHRLSIQNAYIADFGSMPLYSDNCSITSLTLKSCFIEPSAITYLIALPHLTRFSLSDFSLAAGVRSAFAKGMNHHPSLRELVLETSYGQLNRESGWDIFEQEEFISALITNRQLESIKLYGFEFDDRELFWLADGMLHLSKLKNIVLPHSGFGYWGAWKWGSLLGKSANLEMLDVINSHIEADGAIFIAENLPMSLRDLSIHSNPIGPTGAHAIMHNLANNKNVKTLYFDNNNIGDGGAKTITHLLKKNTTVTSLSLAGNNIGEEGIISIADLVNENRTLTSLDITGNKLTLKAVEALTISLKSNNVIKEICLRECFEDVDEEETAEYIDILLAALRDTKTIKKVDLSDNSLTSEDEEKIKLLLKEKKNLNILYE